MSRLLPPSFTSLQCFEASSRYLSFTRAAQELNLTQSAVSKQVAQLESVLERSLFLRVRRRLQLTPEGEIYLTEARKLLSHAEMATRKMRSFSGQREELKVITLVTFGLRWLIPNLNGFRFRHPDIDLNIQTCVDIFDMSERDTDIAFCFGNGVWPGAECIPLMEESMVPICSPGLLNETPVTAALDLTRYVLLHVSYRPEAWHDWFAAQSLQTNHSYHGPRFETFAMALEAAKACCGIALVPHFLVEKELGAGNLIIPWPFIEPSKGRYFIACPEHKRQLDRVKSFIEWIMAKLPASTENTVAKQE